MPHRMIRFRSSDLDPRHYEQGRGTQSRREIRFVRVRVTILDELAKALSKVLSPRRVSLTPHLKRLCEKS